MVKGKNLIQRNQKKVLTLAVVACLTVTSSLMVTSQSFSQQAVTPQNSVGQLPNFRAMIEQNRDAVVNIRGTRSGNELTQNFENAPDVPDNIPEPFRRFFGEQPFGQGPGGMIPQTSQGSGFIISADGYVLTNAHVVNGTDEVVVLLNDRRELPAKIVGVDERSDVAVLKIEAANLPTVQVGNSDQLHVGDWVLAIGSPFGFDHSATQGIVSALSRNLPDGTYVPFIQTDVAVNPGNSGGPLFDLQGNVVGINSQIYSRSGGYQGLSFAIPINLAMNAVDQLKSKGYVSRGWLGVMIQDMTQQLADSFSMDTPIGALVSQVTPDSPAEKAGFKVGDVIVKYDGKVLEHSADLPPLVGSTPIGEKTEVVVMRDGKEQILSVTIGELENQDQPMQLSQADEQAAQKLGIAVAELDQNMRQQMEVDHGVVISQIQPNSAAAKAGLRNGDVILSFNNEEINDAGQLAEIVKQAPTDKPSVVLVKRDRGTLFVPVEFS
jgi:serine protease Do